MFVRHVASVLDHTGMISTRRSWAQWVGWVRWGLWTVAIAQSIGIVYLGEHYLFDALSGLALAVVAAMIARRLVPTLDGSGG